MDTRSFISGLLVLLLLGLTVAWILMLAVGNFGHGQFGLIDCFPAGLLIAWLGQDVTDY